jgi:hypothetical protein
MDREQLAIMASGHPAPSHAGTKPLHIPIVEDFAAIRARLLAIRDAERNSKQAPEPVRPVEPDAVAPGDFYAWLMGGGLWAGG